jgi:hypothetical protein
MLAVCDPRRTRWESWHYMSLFGTQVKCVIHNIDHTNFGCKVPGGICSLGAEVYAGSPQFADTANNNVI